jgi:hypothetical protein
MSIDQWEAGARLMTLAGVALGSAWVIYAVGHSIVRGGEVATAHAIVLIGASKTSLAAAYALDGRSRDITFGWRTLHFGVRRRDESTAPDERVPTETDEPFPSRGDHGAAA